MAAFIGCATAGSKALHIGVFLIVAYLRFRELALLRRIPGEDKSFLPTFAALFTFGLVGAVAVVPPAAGRELAYVGFLLAIGSLGLLNGVLLLINPSVVEEHYTFSLFRSKRMLALFLLVTGVAMSWIAVNGLFIDPTAFPEIYLGTSRR